MKPEDPFDDDPLISEMSQQLADTMPAQNDRAALERVRKARSCIILTGARIERRKMNQAKEDPKVEAVSCPRCGFEGTWNQFDCLGLGQGMVICNRCNFQIDTRTALVIRKARSRIGAKS